jgi:hypothetical protein
MRYKDENCRLFTTELNIKEGNTTCNDSKVVYNNMDISRTLDVYEVEFKAPQSWFGSQKLKYNQL